MMPHDQHEFLNSTSQQVVRAAHDAAMRLNHREIDTEHLLLGLLEVNDPIVTAILTHFDVAPKPLRKATNFVLVRGRNPLLSVQMGELALNVLRAAGREARMLRCDNVRPEHLLLGLLCERQGLASGVLESHRITYDRTRAQIIQLQMQGGQRTAYAIEHQIRFQMTPTLNMVSRDMTAAALAGTLDPMIGREEELDRAMQVLARRTKNNPVLIGEAGVGKTAIAEGLAYRIVNGQVPEHLLNQRVVALDVGLLTIGTKYRGDFEDRLKRVLAEIVAAHNLIIVVDELHTLIGAGVAEGSVDAANLLKPILARGDFRCMGTTTMADYKKTIERDPALERRFQPIIVRATTDEETLQVLNGLRDRYEKFHRVSITPGALRAAVKLSSRYVQDRQQPDKAIDLVDEAAARLCVGRSVLPARVRELRERLAILRDDKDNAIEYEDFPRARTLWKEEQCLRADLQSAEDEWRAWHTSASTPQVTEHEIATVVAAWKGVPAVQIDTDEADKLLHLEDDLHARLIGQEEAVSAVARAIRRSRAELRDPRRPIGSFVFVGPTGVGKTELARALAATLFGDSDALITFDMSEFQEAHHATRLVGAPPGYIGFDQAGKLTEAVRRKPYSVVLFDEIEKAHPRVYDLLLQVLEDGTMSDARGRKVDFRNTVVIMTSNAGMHYLTSRGTMGFAHATDDDAHDTWMSDQVHAAIREVFRPEMLNRIDATILFRPLSRPQMRRITDILLQRVERQLMHREITLTLTTAARDLIATRGYDRQYGARPLRRTIQTLLEDPLAEGVLRGAYGPGDTVTADDEDGTLMLRTTTRIPALMSATTVQ